MTARAVDGPVSPGCAPRMRERQLGKYTTRPADAPCRGTPGRGREPAGLGNAIPALDSRYEDGRLLMEPPRDGLDERAPEIERPQAQRARDATRPRPVRASAEVRAKRSAATSARRFAQGEWWAAFISFTSAPVSILTGHEVWHIESPAQVSRPS